MDGAAASLYRQAIRRLEKDGGAFRVVPAADVPALMPQLRAVSDDWLRLKAGAEKGFSLGFFAEAYLGRFTAAVIMRQLRQSAYVSADVTEPKPNVFYELGIAEGLRKEIILVAKQGTALPFDINDCPVIFWDSFSDFEEELEKRVSQIGAWQGRA